MNFSNLFKNAWSAGKAAGSIVMDFVLSLFISIFSIFLIFCVQANAVVPPELLKFEKNAQAKQSLSAKFKQTIIRKSGKESLTEAPSEGVVEIKIPNCFKWETIKPEKTVLVSDGRNAWYYTPPVDKDDVGQAIRQKAVQSQSAVAQVLLSGQFSKLSDNASFETLSPTRFVMKTKEALAGTIDEIKIQLSDSGADIKEIELHHTIGNRVLIELSQIKWGVSFPRGWFQFIPPRGTNVI